MGVTFSCPLAIHFNLENGLQTILEKAVGVEKDEQPHCSPLLDHKHEEAATKLQKVYKSFRTRRKLADCAVLVEQSWWKLLDFAELKHSSVSFFDLDKHESAISRWARARTRAAKLGKGLAKNGKARKLALQHWLEAIDPRHRYGHNLHFYYVKWLSSQSKEPFFYWLDIGEGKEVNLKDKCPRWKLQQQCIKYLGQIERKAYEVVFENGKLLYKQTAELLDTTKEPKGSKWIFVLSTSNTLYVGKKKKGSFQHSSFLAGGAAVAAGRIVAEKGVLKATWAHSGHYRPTPENFADFLSFLNEHNVDIADVKLDPIDEDHEKSMGKKGGAHLRSSGFEGNLTEKDWWTQENESQSSSNETTSAEDDSRIIPLSSTLHKLSRKLSALEIPSSEGILKKLMDENEKISESRTDSFPPESPREGYETEEDSDQKGKHITSNWSTGAGARISCLRDYPQGLQSQALERLNLSPRSKPRTRLNCSSAGSDLSPLAKLIL